MAVRTRPVQVTTCDGCQEDVYDDPGAEPREGYHGTVSEVAEWGGTGPLTWYACSRTCIPAAVLAVLAADEEARNRS